MATKTTREAWEEWCIKRTGRKPVEGYPDGGIDAFIIELLDDVRADVRRVAAAVAASTGWGAPRRPDAPPRDEMLEGEEEERLRRALRETGEMNRALGQEVDRVKKEFEEAEKENRELSEAVASFRQSEKNWESACGLKDDKIERLEKELHVAEAELSVARQERDRFERLLRGAQGESEARGNAIVEAKEQLRQKCNDLERETRRRESFEKGAKEAEGRHAEARQALERENRALREKFKWLHERAGEVLEHPKPGSPPADV